MSRNREVFLNFIWRFLERCGAQGVSFIVSIILARILDPEVYGTVALMNVFTILLSVFIDSGMGSALIQKKDADELDFSTLFYFNLGMCIILYVLMFFCAPLIARFYGRNELVSMIRVLSLTLIVSGVKNIQNAYVSKNMLFKKFFFATLGGTIGAAIIGIFLAYLGYGAWALIIQSLFNNCVDTIILWITVKWRPQKKFSFTRLKILFSFGWKIMVSSLLDRVYRELRTLIIGKKYSSEDLAFYNRGQQFPVVVVDNINSSIDSVLFPSMAAVQDIQDKVRGMTRRAIKVSCYIMMPLMVGLAVCAEPLIRILLTEKWLPSVFFMRVFCFSYAFWPIHTANLNAIKALGRSDLFLRLEVIKKIVGLIALLSTMWISVKAMAYSLLFTSVTSQLINSWPNKRLLNYSYIEQLKDIFPSMILSIVMGICVLQITRVGLSDIITLLMQILVGGIIYIIGSRLFRIDSWEYLVCMLKEFHNK